MNPVYALGYWLSRTTFDLLFPGETGGTEFVPKNGGFLLAANHASFLDPPAIGCRLPRASHYLARKTLFKPGIRDRVLRKVHAIPVDLENESDISALKAVFRVIKEGEPVLLFPEGTRTSDGQLQPARPGVGMIACKSAAPVVPARIFGSFDALSRYDRRARFFTPIHVGFGRPLSPAEYDPGGKGKDRYQEASQRIMDAIARIPPPPEVLI